MFLLNVQNHSDEMICENWRLFPPEHREKSQAGCHHKVCTLADGAELSMQMWHLDMHCVWCTVRLCPYASACWCSLHISHGPHRVACAARSMPGEKNPTSFALNLLVDCI